MGPGWQVIASMGHIRSLEETLDAVGLDRDFEPRYQFLKEKSKAIQHIKDSAKGASKIYLASDDDREGEAIAYSIAVLLGLPIGSTPRSVFHEITESAVKKAVREPRLLDMAKVEAQQARSILDMMVGFTISPLLWSYIGPSLSAGRCQTPALRLLCDKEQTVSSFTSETVWKLKGSWSSGSFHFPAELKDCLEDQESAVNFLENLHNDGGAKVFTTLTRQWTESPPKPLITSTLQQEASALYGSNPKRTMQIAQRLYEAGHITYMRTDHAVISDEAKAIAIAYVKKQFGDPYVGTILSKQKVQNAQEAHEAIRPTHFEMVELDSGEWTPLDKKIYKLIWTRSIQSVMSPAKGDERIITFIADGDPGEFPWEARWKRTTFLGWKKIGSTAVLDEAEADDTKQEDAATWIQAINLREGDSIKWSSLEGYPHVSKAPPRYNEATLVRELEKKGIGRPSTYASLVETLFDKKYSEKKTVATKDMSFTRYILGKVGTWPPTKETFTKKIGGEKDKMVPTPLGLSILDFCMKEFPSLFDYGFTAQMESRLDKVAEKSEVWKNVCRDTWNSYKDHYTELKKSGSKNKSAKVHEFSDGLKAVIGKKGPLLLKEIDGDKEKTVFYGWPDGIAFNAMTEEMAVKFIQGNLVNTLGEHDGHSLIKKKGPFGHYVECGSVKVPVVDGDTVDTIKAKIDAKKANNLHTLGPFEFRNGPYGVFMYKKVPGTAKPVFVSLPEGLDPKTLTLEATTRLYDAGVAAKGSGSRGGWRGRGRGRGK